MAEEGIFMVVWTNVALAGLTLVFLYSIIPRRYGKSAKLAIASSLFQFVIILPGFLLLLWRRNIPTDDLLIAIFTLCAILCIAINHEKLKSIENIKRSGLGIYYWLKDHPPSTPTILFFSAIFIICFIPVASIAPINPDFDWTDVVFNQSEYSEIRPLSFVLYNPLMSALLVLAFVLFLAAFLYEKQREYLGLAFLTFALFIVIMPVVILGRPWGVDTYTMGWFLEQQDTGISGFGYTQFFFAIELIFFQNVIGLSTIEALILLVPLLNSQIFLGIWIIHTSKRMQSIRAKILLLLVSFAPLLLQFSRIGNTTVIGIYFMFLTIWLLEKVTSKDGTSSKREWLVDSLFASVAAFLTGLHQMTALILVVYLLLQPIRYIIKGNHKVSISSFLCGISLYLSLELGGFFTYRIYPLLSSVGIAEFLLQARIIIFPNFTYEFRPIFLVAVIVLFTLVIGFTKIVSRVVPKEKLVFVRNVSYRVLSFMIVALAIGFVGIIVVFPDIMTSLQIIPQSPIELYLFYSIYIFMILLIPLLIRRNSPSEGALALLLIISHVAYFVPLILFNFGGGLLTRVVISMPLVVSFLNTDVELMKKGYLLERLGILIGILLCALGIIGSLLVSFHI